MLRYTHTLTHSLSFSHTLVAANMIPSPAKVYLHHACPSIQYTNAPTDITQSAPRRHHHTYQSLPRRAYANEESQVRRTYRVVSEESVYTCLPEGLTTRRSPALSPISFRLDLCHLASSCLMVSWVDGRGG